MMVMVLGSGGLGCANCGFDVGLEKSNQNASDWIGGCDAVIGRSPPCDILLNGLYVTTLEFTGFSKAII